VCVFWGCIRYPDTICITAASSRTSELLLLQVACMSLKKFLENISLKLARNDNYNHQHEILGSESFPTVMMKSFIFWDMTPCSLSSLCYLLHAVFFLVNYSTLKMKAVRSSATSVDFQRTTRHYISEDRTLHEVVGWEITAIHCVLLGERDVGCFGRWIRYQMVRRLANCELDSQPWLTSCFLQ
jgi:hypothetical protein